MLKKKHNKLHIIDLVFVVEEAMRRLPNGEGRFSVSNIPLSYAWLHQFQKSDPTEQILSDYGVSNEGNKEIEKAYYEEVAIIEKVMEEANVPIKLADWQSTIKTDSSEEMRCYYMLFQKELLPNAGIAEIVF